MKADNLIYFDNAATSYPKPKCVIDAVSECLTDYCGNPSRSSHMMSVRAAECVYNARCAVADFFSLENEEHVVFTHNATYALNMAIKTLITQKCHVICSDLEHNSVIRVLEKLRDSIGLSYSVFDSNKDISEEIRRLYKKNTEYVICTACSNVTGKNIDLFALSNVCRELGLGVIIDASQAAGHTMIDLNRIKCSALCAPSHKSLYGIQGSGFVIFSEDMPKTTYIEGGSGSYSISKRMPDELPDMLEAGTPNVPACAALTEGLSFIKNIGIEQIESKISQIKTSIHERLLNMDKVTVLAAEGPILSFNIADIPSTVIAQELDKLGICTRSGLHCSPSAHKKLGTLSQGAVRLSFSYFNNTREADIFCDNINDILKDAVY